MKSPFPGMDPYLEPHWLDVHTKMIAYAADDLNERLPEDLVASTEERVAVAEEGEDRLIGPDVQVLESPVQEQAKTDLPAAVAGLAPYRLTALDEPITERFIRIVEIRTERLITVIEFVSPTNKRKRGLHAFRRKRAELVASGVNFVEVDLVRSGNWRALLRPFRCPSKALSLYRATYRVPHDSEASYLLPIPLNQPLPSIVVPLRPNDPLVRLDLQALLDRTYEKGRYWRRINYTQPLDPSLAGEDAAWAEELLRAAGKR
jgi:hypothetical protein